MRETRTSGSEGGGGAASPYPYPAMREERHWGGALPAMKGEVS